MLNKVIYGGGGSEKNGKREVVEPVFLLEARRDHMDLKYHIGICFK